MTFDAKWNSNNKFRSVWNSDQVLSSVWSLLATFGCHKDHITHCNLGAGEVIITVIMKILLNLGNIKLQSLGLSNSKRVKKLNNNILERWVRHVLTEIKVQRIQCGGRILRGDNTGVRAAMLRRIGFYRVGAWLCTGLPAEYIKAVDHVCRPTQYRLRWNCICARNAVT